MPMLVRRGGGRGCVSACRPACRSMRSRRLRRSSGCAARSMPRRLPCASSRCRNGASSASAASRSASSPWRAGPGLLDIGALAPFAGAVAAASAGTSCPSSCRPEMRPGRPAATRSLRASSGAVLTVAGHDHQAAALAVGAARPGALFNSLGTAEALVAAWTGRSIHPPSAGSPRAERPSAGALRAAARPCRRGCARDSCWSGSPPLLGANDRASRRLLGEQALEVDLAEIPPGVIVSGAETRPQLASFADGLPAAAVWAAAVRDLTAASARRLERIEAEIGPHSHVTRSRAAGRATRRCSPPSAGSSATSRSAAARSRRDWAALLAGVAAGVVESPETDAAPVWPGSRVPRANSEVS